MPQSKPSSLPRAKESKVYVAGGLEGARSELRRTLALSDSWQRPRLARRLPSTVMVENIIASLLAGTCLRSLIE